MAQTIDWTLNVQVSGGPKLSVSQTIDIEAYDVITATIPKKTGSAGTATVSVQPGAATAIRFMLITTEDSTLYNDDLSYSINAAETTVANRIKLDGPQMMIGDGGMKMLGAAPNSLYFYNNLTSDVVVNIIIGRKAT